MGVYKICDLDLDIVVVKGVVWVLDYLIVLNWVDLGDEILDYEDGELNVKGKCVVVIGGGDIVMDCVCIVICQGV